MPIEYSEFSTRANGGTERVARELEKRLPAELMEKVQIIPSRLRGKLDPTKIRIFWAHDCAVDQEAAILKNGGWRKFHRIVFVSHTQKLEYQMLFQIPSSRCHVLLNAINPIPVSEEKHDGIRLVYTPTPHRGLGILYAVFDQLTKNRPDLPLHLDVFSSFKLYGWDQEDEKYRALFDLLEQHPKITWHGTVDHDVLTASLAKSHIFAYPSIYQETACICLMEAMSAGLLCVHSDLGALPETAANWTFMYPYHEDQSKHAGQFYATLEAAIDNLSMTKDHLAAQKMYADEVYGWDKRAAQWEGFIRSILNLPLQIEGPNDFVYKVG